MQKTWPFRRTGPAKAHDCGQIQCLPLQRCVESRQWQQLVLTSGFLMARPLSPNRNFARCTPKQTVAVFSLPPHTTAGAPPPPQRGGGGEGGGGGFVACSAEILYNLTGVAKMRLQQLARF